VPFDDGNNLESISEAVFASWAAARWFTATGRPGIAATFVARFTIESTVANGRWLPAGEDLPTDTAQRPWSGVVWAAKSDNTTWFHPAPEAALGIRLLPLSPASLARYGDAPGVAAAGARWTWCRDHGGGCGTMWSDLLATDAAVAGVAGPVPAAGAEPEGSTPAELLRWWADLWAASTPAEHRCTPGAVARRTASGDVVVLASNPAPAPVALRCVGPDGAVWSETLPPGGRARVTLR
jgi:hypothetical protein